MRRLVIALVACALLGAPAQAAVPHTVQEGETLWSVAAASNLTTRTVAAFNGLSEDAPLAVGSTVRIPTTDEGAAALAAAGITPQAPAAPDPQAVAAPAAAAAAPAGAYAVRPGDTLSGIAAGSGASAADIAAMNGLDPSGILVAGTVIELPTGTPTPAAAPVPAETAVHDAARGPTPGRVDPGQVGGIAAAHGVDASLATAIAWQESGFDNAAVSSADARGVMQVMPGTWSYIQEHLASSPLDSRSPTDNVHAGVLYLRRLLDETGDETTAIAAYYQGLGSVRSRGLFDDTRRYVENVQALRARFGG